MVRLAKLMFESMGVAADDAEWQLNGKRQVEERLGLDLAVFVVDHPARPGKLVATAAGTIAARLPVPTNPGGRVGYVQWVATEPSFRLQGLGRMVMEALLAWFDDSLVPNVELHATSHGAPLYRALGFWTGSGGVALRRRPWDPPRET